MLRKILTILVFSSFIAAPMALAEYSAGDREMTLSGSGSSDNDFDTTGFTAEGSLGYFFTPTVEGVIRQGVGVLDTPGESSWNGSTRLGVDLNFPMERFVPFLGVNGGYLYGDDVEDTWLAGPDAGLKAFVNDTTFVLAAVEYQFLFDDADEVDENFDDGRFVYTLGLGFKW